MLSSHHDDATSGRVQTAPRMMPSSPKKAPASSRQRRRDASSAVVRAAVRAAASSSETPELWAACFLWRLVGESTRRPLRAAPAASSATRSTTPSERRSPRRTALVAPPASSSSSASSSSDEAPWTPSERFGFFLRTTILRSDATHEPPTMRWMARTMVPACTTVSDGAATYERMAMTASAMNWGGLSSKKGIVPRCLRL
mmetsp:Transcript_25807/g.103086  ORF Transcript_25807/g.103086 Transcript_25807/m.103086 type:complete len:200 (-) Transcript_25807:1944-2543(-)